MSGYLDPPHDYEYGETMGMGSAHSVSSEAPERDIVDQLRDVVEEVTGKPVRRQERRIGFL